LAGTLLRHGLIDQLALKINPVWLDEGLPLFGDPKPRLHLELRDSKTYSNGFVKAVYAIKP
jgi:dihydrofolate reductase